MKIAIALPIAIASFVVMYLVTDGLIVLSAMTALAVTLAVVLLQDRLLAAVEEPRATQVARTQASREQHDTRTAPADEPVPPPPVVVEAIEPVALPETLEPIEVVRALRHAAKAMTAHVWLADPTSETLRLVVCDGPVPINDTPVPIDDGVFGRALGSATSVSGRVSRITTPSESLVVHRHAFRIGAGDLTGVAAVDLRDEEPDPPRLEAVRSAFMPLLGGSLALHASRLEMHSTRELLDAARELTRLLDPDAVLEAALTRAIDIASGKTASILLQDDDGTLSIAASRGLEDEIVESTSLAVGEGIAGWVFASKTPLVIEDLDSKSQGRRHGIRSAISVPVADEDGILGVLNVGSPRFSARASDSHLRALESLGRLTALALRNARAVQTSGELYLDSLKALVTALETKDPYAQGGTDRVFEIARILGREVGMTDAEYDALSLAALLHDIGMIAAGETAMIGTRPLSVAERGLLKMHPVIAAEILESAPMLEHVAPIVYHHHERFDGSGYVAGYSGDAIPLGARVLAVADAYVAMTSDRPYRPALTHEEALTEMREKSGTQFDPHVIDCFERLMSDGANRVPDDARGQCG